MTSTDNKIPSRSPAYDEDGADITLISSEAEEFKVHAYMLKANSTIFRDMLGDPAFRPSGSIDIEASSEDLTYFLNFMYKCHAEAPQTWDQAKRILDLCDKFDCEIVSKRIRCRLKRVVRGDPWEAFALASHHHDIKMAEWASRGLGFDEKRKNITSDTISLADASKVSLPYLLGFLHLSHSSVSWNETTRTYEKNWNSLGKKFTLRE
ncbi:hypothetical protein L486_08519 [Kwoniella mangroviensis CBS 10435]|uniref:BTB domain-containing protein n=1 Tax=Kwoniella mangroviensis CBS 10435 TaxID=1331196 RepID=A0A1B9IEL9_9TREE|nr:hypothetical protein L486_08519 [Kwoniella mangroviensis CBS 10435]